MNVYRFALLAALSSCPAFAQTNALPTSGNVGIGTTTPSTALQVTGGVLLNSSASTMTSGFNGEFGNPNIGNSGGFRVNRNSGAAGTKIFSSFHANSGHEFYHEVLSQSDSRFVFLGGNVGIGATSPWHRLHVEASSSNATAYFHNSSGWSGSEYSLQAAGYSDFNGLRLNGQDTSRVIYSESTIGIGTNNKPITFDTQIGQEMMRISQTGNVGIGTTNPTHKLAVNGTIKAKEVIVETTGWSDYVFADDYTLAPLAEVEAHIKEHKHLPGIPSAAQVADQGISVGDMQAKLLAKIEELTLHQIAQEKEITLHYSAQQKELASLRAENAALKARVQQLEIR